MTTVAQQLAAAKQLRRLLASSSRSPRSAALSTATNEELVEAAECLAEAHRRRAAGVGGGHAGKHPLRSRRRPSFAAEGEAAADAAQSSTPPRDEGTAAVEALAAEVASRASKGAFPAADLAAVASSLGKAGLWSHHLKSAVLKAAAPSAPAAEAAAVPPAALALLAEAYSHLALHDDHGVFDAIAARLAGENDAVVVLTEEEEEGEGGDDKKKKRPSPPSVIAVTAPHAFTAEDVARIAAAASRCYGGAFSPALVDAVAAAAARLAEAASEAGDARSLAAAAAAAADVGGASAHPRCASLLALAADALDKNAAAFGASGCGDALPTALRALVAGGLLEERVFARAAEAACASRGAALSEMSDDGIVSLTRAFADARAHDSALFDAVEKEVLRRLLSRGFCPEKVVELLAAFNRTGFVSGALADVAERAARAVAAEVEGELLEDEEIEGARGRGGGGGTGVSSSSPSAASAWTGEGRRRKGGAASVDDMS